MSECANCQALIAEGKRLKRKLVEVAEINNAKVSHVLKLEAENARLNSLIEQARTAIEPVRDASGTWVDHIGWLVEREARLREALEIIGGFDCEKSWNSARGACGGSPCVTCTARAALSGESSATKEEGSCYGCGKVLCHGDCLP